MLIELSEDHVDGCIAVIRSLPEWFGYEGAVEGVADALRSQSGIVAVEDDSVTGFMTFCLVFDESLEITYLAVDARHRRRGIGRALVAAAQTAATVQGATSICLLTLGPSALSKPQDETIAFYRSLGFLRMKELYLSAWGGAPTLVMSLPLSPAA